MPLTGVLGALCLALIVAACTLASRLVLARCGEARLSVAAALTLGVLQLLPERIGWFSGGMRGGALVCGALAVGVVLVERARRRRAATTGAMEPPLPPYTRADAVVAAALVLAFASVTLTTWLWDETSVHLPLAAALSRGVVPAELPVFPGQPLRYHAGYACLSAIVRAFTGLATPAALDVATLASLAVTVWLSTDLGKQLGGPSALAPLLLLACFGPLGAFFADGYGVSLPLHPLPSEWIDPVTLPPPPVSNFLQHPQGIGLPLVLAAVLVVDGARTHARFALACVFAVLCGHAQTVFALVLLTGLALVAVARARELRSVRVLAELSGILLVAGAALPLTATLLWPGSSVASSLSFGAQASWAGPLLARTAKHVLLLGPAAVAVVAWPVLVLARRAPPRPMALLLVWGCAGVALMVPNVVRYDNSYDIVKFTALGVFLGNVVAFALPSALPRVVGRAWLAVCLACTASSGLWLLRYGPLNGVIAAHVDDAHDLADATRFDACYGDALPPRAVIVAPDVGLAWAGFLVPGIDWRAGNVYRTHRFDRHKADATRGAVVAALTTMSPASLTFLNASYVAVGPDDDDALSEEAKRALTDQTRFRLVAPSAGCAQDPKRYTVYAIVP
ncbi:MAG: hypothetical protein IT383_09945 [Deltaproteobacteria bacterium]|nr:hypothetical protein [Deltaproteobacteria bacterium]